MTGFFVYAKTKTQNSCTVTAQLISAFVFAIRIVQSLYYLNLKFQASSHLPWLYRPVCVGPGRKPRRPVFSQRDSIMYINSSLSLMLFCFFYEENVSELYSRDPYKTQSDEGFLMTSKLTMSFLPLPLGMYM